MTKQRLPRVHAPRKGRGAVDNIAHRFESLERELDRDALEAALISQEPDGSPSRLKTTVTHEQAKSLLAYNDSPDIPFDRSINPYRGCEHGCVYCYARPTHSYLGLSPGLDFESKLTAKTNAVELLQKELSAPSYRPALVNIGSATDAYQPIERELQLTRRLIEVLVRTKHPFTIVTKGSLVERDKDLIAEAATLRLSTVFISLTTLDHRLSALLEPRAASPARRLQTITALTAVGIPVQVNAAPVIPFITEPELEKILEAAKVAGAGAAHYTVLRLPWEVNPLFQDWLEAHFPDRAQRVMNRVREMRHGKDYEAQFGERMKGEGVWADLIRQRFTKACDRLGLATQGPTLRTDLFVPPARRQIPPGSLKQLPQLGLFDNE